MNPVVTENFMKVMEVAITQQTFTCSKSTIEAIEKDKTYVQSLQKRQQNDVINIVMVDLSLTLNIFHTFFSAFIVDFEQLNVG